MKRKFFSAVLSAMILAMASVGVTASAEETPTTAENVAVEETTEETASESEKPVDTPTTETPSEINVDEFMKYMSQFADAGNVTFTDGEDDSLPDYYGDDYYDTKGNATLIKSEHIIYNTEEMQFIAVTTKDGNVFYVLINYSAENGEDNVYFLNKVDAVDLYSLIYMTDEEEENGIDMDNVKKAEDAAMSALNKDKSSADTDNSDTFEIPDGTENSPSEQPTNKSMSANNLYLIIGIVAILGIGGAGFFIMKKKPKNKAVAETEEDEEINFYDDSENEDEE